MCGITATTEGSASAVMMPSNCLPTIGKPVAVQLPTACTFSRECLCARAEGFKAQPAFAMGARITVTVTAHTTLLETLLSQVLSFLADACLPNELPMHIHGAAGAQKGGLIQHSLVSSCTAQHTAGR